MILSDGGVKTMSRSANLRVLEAGLLCALALAVFAYGGTAFPYFSLVQVAMLGLGAWLMLAELFQVDRRNFPIATPMMFVAFALFQLVPLPTQWLRLVGRLEDVPAKPRFAALSLAPYDTFSQLLLLMTCLAAFYLTLAVCRDAPSTRRMARAVAILGTLEAGFGLVLYLGGWNPLITGAPPPGLDAVTGTFINRNHLAGLLGMTLPFSLAFVYQEFVAIRRESALRHMPASAFLSHTNSHRAFLWLLAGLLQFVAVVFSQSRMGILSVGASLLLVLCVLLTSRWRRRGAALVGGLFLCVAIGAILWMGPDPVLARFSDLKHEYSSGSGDRLAIWQDTLRLVRQHPWLGTGFGTFSIAYPAVQTTLPNMFVEHAHNDYLELITELGLPAALFFIGAVIWLLFRSARETRFAKTDAEFAVALGAVAALFAICLHSFADFNLHVPANCLVFSVVLGLACASRPPSNERAIQNGPLRLPAS